MKILIDARLEEQYNQLLAAGFNVAVVPPTQLAHELWTGFWELVYLKDDYPFPELKRLQAIDTFCRGCICRVFVMRGDTVGPDNSEFSIWCKEHLKVKTP